MAIRAIGTVVFLAAAILPLSAEEPATTITETPITAADREHWAFRPLERPAVPDVDRVLWCRNPIDRFILAKLEEAGLEPMPQAGQTTLLRRVTFDLTGLPPRPEEIAAFVNDESPDAYEKVVDRLLASDAYGERWAQHWLDLARFAETDGFEHDKVRPEAWRYRDWVIRALNADMPYDQFVRLQLAGDEVAGVEQDASPQHEGLGAPLRSDPSHPSQAAAAVQFLTCGPDMPDINSQARRRHIFLNDMTATVGSVFLGMQFGCAQCHDHKYDPISQADFYRLRAFFAPMFGFDRYKPVRLRDEPDEAPAHFMIRGDYQRKGPEVEPAFPRVVNYGGVAGVEQEASPQRDRLEAPARSDPSHPSGSSPATRAALAKWLTRADHPLTTRVIVNRLWQHHFGRGLVQTPSDFGLMGQWPTHPELLDWLATELPRRGWSLKAMHRLMVTSAAYRQASRPHRSTPAASSSWGALWQSGQRRDPDNNLLWRMNRRRLEGEAIRDAMLAASGSLTQRRGGPGIRPPLPPELLVTLLKNQWPVTKDETDHDRRSIYLFVRRNLQYPLFAVFDRPDTNLSCPRRNESTIAPQALMLLNSELSLDAAARLSGYLIRHAGADTARQVRLGFLRTLGREPTPEEQRLAVRYLEQETTRLREEKRSPEQLALPDALPADADPHSAAALTSFCLSLFNLNEFVYID